MTADQQLTATDLTDPERDLIADIRQHGGIPAFPGERYPNALALLLDVGRLFTPRAWPDGPPPGEPGRCYAESVSWAWGSPDGLAYVEGLAWAGVYFLEHAWCGDRDGFALDPTWAKPAAAYLGLPVDAEVAARLVGKHAGPLLELGGTVWREWMRGGVPSELLVDIGRPIPRNLLPPALRGR